MQKINNFFKRLGAFYEAHFTHGIGFWTLIATLYVVCAII